MTSAAREAIVLPIAFLTVLLLGSVRVAETTILAPPSVFALVLGLLFVRIVVQSGTLAPERLLASSRSVLANANGFVALVGLWLAAAQVIALLIPESGLPRIVLAVYLLLLLVNTAAAAPDRTRLLRSVAVTFGALFLLKFVVLAQLSTPGNGRVNQVMQALLEGVTLGALLQPPAHAVTGYLALAALMLFLVTLLLLPTGSVQPDDGALVRSYGESIQRS
jgi:hypothetical protein